MKKVLLVLMLCLTILPFGIKAEGKKEGIISLNLDQALTEEGIEHDFSNYKETDDQITIYVFRGKGCPHCEDFLKFLNSIIGEYGKYFKVVSYETWYNKDNQRLQTKAAIFLGDLSTGVPYIIIGDETFAGYASDYDEYIKKAIKDEYDKKNRYDVFKEMEKDENKNKPNYPAIILSELLIAIVVGGYIICTNNKKNKVLKNQIELLNERITKIETNKKETIKEEVKKETSKKEISKKEKTKTKSKK